MPKASQPFFEKQYTLPEPVLTHTNQIVIDAKRHPLWCDSKEVRPAQTDGDRSEDSQGGGPEGDQTDGGVEKGNDLR